MDGSVLPQEEGFRRHKLTVQDYHRMGEAGMILKDEDRVELIEGDHASIGSSLTTDLAQAFGRDAQIAMQIRCV